MRIRSHNQIVSRSKRTARIRWRGLVRVHFHDLHGPILYYTPLRPCSDIRTLASSLRRLDTRSVDVHLEDEILYDIYAYIDDRILWESVIMRNSTLESKMAESEYNELNSDAEPRSPGPKKQRKAENQDRKVNQSSTPSIIEQRLSLLLFSVPYTPSIPHTRP